MRCGLPTVPSPAGHFPDQAWCPRVVAGERTAMQEVVIALHTSFSTLSRSSARFWRMRRALSRLVTRLLSRRYTCGKPRSVP